MSAPHDAVISIPPYDPYRLATVLRELTGDKLNVWSQRLSRTKAWSRLRVEGQGMRLANNVRVPWDDGMNVAECVERLARLNLWPWDAGDGIARFVHRDYTVTPCVMPSLATVPRTHEEVVCFASIPPNVVLVAEELATRYAMLRRAGTPSLRHELGWAVGMRWCRYSSRCRPEEDVQDAINLLGFGTVQKLDDTMLVEAPHLHEAHVLMPVAGVDWHRL